MSTPKKYIRSSETKKTEKKEKVLWYGNKNLGVRLTNFIISLNYYVEFFWSMTWASKTSYPNSLLRTSTSQRIAYTPNFRHMNIQFTMTCNQCRYDANISELCKFNRQFCRFLSIYRLNSFVRLHIGYSIHLFQWWIDMFYESRETTNVLLIPTAVEMLVVACLFRFKYFCVWTAMGQKIILLISLDTTMTRNPQKIDLIMRTPKGQ